MIRKLPVSGLHSGPDIDGLLSVTGHAYALVLDGIVTVFLTSKDEYPLKQSIQAA